MIGKTEELVDLKLANVQPLHLPQLEQNQTRIDILRLDKIHPIISGNKWFKLKYALQDALSQNKISIITIGGAYSNHLLATAFASRELGLKSYGLIKGELPKTLSCTLEAAADLGMNIDFLPRSFFQNNERLISYLVEKYPESYLVEEGGKNEKGIEGAAEMLKLVDLERYDYICCSIGTGTMMAGLVTASLLKQRVIGISSLKISDRENELSRFLERNSHSKKNYHIIYDYHFGGYAKHNKELLDFMNNFFFTSAIPTDFVYTAKLMYGVLDLVKKKYFDPGKSLLVIHSGGLQGNCSLPKDTLLY